MTKTWTQSDIEQEAKRIGLDPRGPPHGPRIGAGKPAKDIGLPGDSYVDVAEKVVYIHKHEQWHYAAAYNTANDRLSQDDLNLCLQALVQLQVSIANGPRTDQSFRQIGQIADLMGRIFTLRCDNAPWR